MMDKMFGFMRMNIFFVLSFSNINIVKYIRNLYVIYVWKRKIVFKRIFFNWDDLIECVKICINYIESVKDLMELLKVIYGGILSLLFILYVEIGWN